MEISEYSQYKKNYTHLRWYANYPDLVITQYIHVLKCHTVPHKYIHLKYIKISLKGEKPFIGLTTIVLGSVYFSNLTNVTIMWCELCSSHFTTEEPEAWRSQGHLIRRWSRGALNDGANSYLPMGRITEPS